MQRDLRLLESHEFDMLVIGSGMYGACLAREAAMRGLRVALIDKGDFGEATSANSLKVIHGGLRYLQHFNWIRMRESIRARRQLLTIAPYLVRPRRFLMPTRGLGLQSKWVMRAALLINDLISADRNRGITAARKTPRGRILSRREFVDLVPEMSQISSTGAAEWSDGYVEHTERLMMALVHSAVQLKAVAANYVCADSYILDGTRIKGANVTDSLTGRSFRIAAKSVVNTAGPGSASLNADLPGQAPGNDLSWVKGYNLFIRRPLFPEAVGLSSTTRHVDRDAVIDKGSRLYFFVPWQGGTLVGTDYAPARQDGDPTGLDQGQLQAMLNEINAMYPDADVKPDDVAFCHAGLLPASNRDESIDAAARLLKHTRVIDHQASSGITGLYTVTGIKYTVAPQVVITVLDNILSSMNVHAPRPDPEPVLYGAESIDENSGGSENARLYERYGSRYVELIGLADEVTGRAACVDDDTGTTVAEVIHAVRNEMAMTLPDVVYRRTAIGMIGKPSDQTLAGVAEIMARELDWDAQQVEHEIRSVSEDSSYCRS